MSSQHIGGYVAEKAQRRVQFMIVVVFVAPFIVAVGLRHLPHAKKKAPATSDGSAVTFFANGIFANGSSSIMISADNYGNDVVQPVSKEWSVALAKAENSWKHVLPGYRLPSHPTLSQIQIGGSHGGLTAIACANPQTNEIYVVSKCDTAECDKFSVMLHEYAHLLGVPHIEDDPFDEPGIPEKRWWADTVCNRAG